ncbi:Cullin-4 [Borealophlyctis nickersoniae]|nr:Cullin-4 [Borealophlyctis nickersoniae]
MLQTSSANKGKAPALPTGISGLRPAGTPKKLVIKAFKVKPKLPETYESDTWDKLKRAVHAIHDRRPVPDSLEELYKIFAAQIMIRSIFLYLDRTYVLQTASLKSLWDMGIELFRSNIMDDTDVRRKTIEGILDEIERERNGDQVSRELLRSLLRMFLDLSIYLSGFDPAFRDRTERYYRAESDRLVGGMDGGVSGGTVVARYVLHVEARLGEEVERCTPGVGYLDLGSKKGLVAVVETELVKRHVRVLLDKGFAPLMDENRMEDLARMFDLFGRVGGRDEMRHKFAEYIKKTGTALIMDSSRDATMVEDLLKFKSRLDEILAKSFCSNEGFANSLKESFEHFINSRKNKPAELIAKFVDSKLKSGKGVSEREIEGLLDQCLVLFRFIQGKDVFEAFYKKDLAKRLLLSKSASVDAEKSMLSKLKTECGSGFTSKLEGMFKDMEVSKDFMMGFKQSTKFVERLGSVELNANILTAGYWPTYPPQEVILPFELANAQEVFKEFYMQKHSGRRLTWMNSLGSCVLKAEYPKAKKELSVSLFQAVVLLLFNDSRSLTYTEIREQTSIEARELERTLQSLACGKLKILHKHPKGRDVATTDTFEYNDAFEYALTRIKVNAIQLKETAEENKGTTERVFQDRQYQVDAAIVRIMKMRKRLSHAVLLSELFEHLKFPIQAPDLKKRIESLIDREYLERDAKDATVYVYLA